MNSIDWTMRRVLAESIEDLGLEVGDVIVLESSQARACNALGYTHEKAAACSTSEHMVAVTLTEKGLGCLLHLN